MNTDVFSQRGEGSTCAMALSFSDHSAKPQQNSTNEDLQENSTRPSGGQDGDHKSAQFHQWEEFDKL